jgi:hypothetical protein
MYYTEEQARQHECRIGSLMSLIAVVLQHELIDSLCRCKASECMWWRWKSGSPSDNIGFCGIAGRP